jgi:4-aminobutyrate aminotransferase
MDHARAFAMHTTAGNPVCTAAGCAVLRVIESEGLAARAAETGEVLAGGLRALAQRHAIIGDVRGRGLALGVDLVSDRGTREPAPAATAAKVILRAYQLGAVFFSVGLSGNVLELTPALTLTAAEAREGIDIIDRALRDVAQGRVADADVAPYMMW